MHASLEKDLKEAAETKLSVKEMKKLEEIADESGTRILGADLFRFAVKKTKSKTRGREKSKGSE